MTQEIYRLAVALASFFFTFRAYQHAKEDRIALTVFYAVGWLGIILSTTISNA